MARQPTTNATRPLWTCPECGHRFVTQNLWHSCGRVDLEEHFRGKPAQVRETFQRWVAAAEAVGPVTVYAQKTRIVFQVRVRFGGAVIRTRWVQGRLWLKRRAEHPLLVGVEDYGRLGYGHLFRLERPEDIDQELEALMRESYAVGAQEQS